MERSPIRMLLVDDDDANGYLLKLACQRHCLSIELHQAFSYEDAVAINDVGQYNLVLSDFNLLDYDAIDVCKHVHSIDSDAIVIAISGSFTKEQCRRIKAAGVNACFEKEAAEPLLEKILAFYQAALPSENPLR